MAGSWDRTRVELMAFWTAEMMAVVSVDPSVADLDMTWVAIWAVVLAHPMAMQQVSRKVADSDESMVVRLVVLKGLQRVSMKGKQKVGTMAVW